MENQEFKTENLKLLRSLRTQEKAIKARIDEISSKAADEAIAILSSKGLDRGEFDVDGIGSFQLQRTDVIDMTNYNRYKGEMPSAGDRKTNRKSKVVSTKPPSRAR